MSRVQNAGRTRLLLILGLGLALLTAFSLLYGRYPDLSMLSFERISNDVLAQRLMFNLRLPRILTAILAGMTLSAAGYVFQMLFGNPLVEPGFLGVSQGAAFGAALAIVVFSNAAWLVQGMAAFFGILALATTYYMAHKVRYGGWVLRLVLAGIAISALFSSGVGVLKYFADPLKELPEITFWLLGGLYGITWTRFLSILPAVVIGLIILYRMRWRLNVLSLSDETAFSLGAAPQRERALLLVAAVVATAAIISVAGMVGWVGLIMPHIARRLFGADARYSLTASMILGAAFMLICDDLARTLMAGEIPLGILTSLIGAVGFMILMTNQRVAVQK